MKNVRKGALLAVFVAAMLSVNVTFASIVAVGNRGSAIISVESGKTTTVTDTALFADGGEVDKVGAGELRISAAAVRSNTGKAVINVRDGKFSLTRDAMTVTDRLALLNGAALWLKADENVIAAEGKVMGWLDCRETATSAPYERYHGYVINTVEGEPHPQVVDGPLGKAVDFKGYGSGNALVISAAEDEKFPTTIDNVQDVFIVHTVTDCKNWGFLVGEAGAGYHPQNANANESTCYGRTDRALWFNSRWWINGVEIDAVKTVVENGDFVYDMRHYDVTKAQIKGVALYTNSTDPADLPERNGGDLVYEMLVFATPLTEAEHAEVRQYLLDKYLKNGPVSIEINVADGACVDIAEGLANVKVNNAGECALAAGESKVVNEDFAYPIVVGERLVVDATRDGSLVSRSSAATADAVEKSGRSYAAIRSVPAGTKIIAVESGTLAITPNQVSPVPAGSEVVATIAEGNGDFEQPFAANPTGLKKAADQTVNNWTWAFSCEGAFNDSYASLVKYPYETASPAWYDVPLDAGMPEGSTRYLAIRGDSDVYTTVSVPVSGKYRLSYYTMASTSFGPVQGEVLLGETYAQLRSVGGSIYMKTGVWVPVSFDIPFDLSAGEKVICFRGRPYQDKGWCNKCGYMVDEVKLELVSRAKDVWPVPNGDFELIVPAQSVSSGKGSSLVKSTFSADYQPMGWTLTSPTDSYSAGLVWNGIGNGKTTSLDYSAPAIMGGGLNQLLLVAEDAKANSDSFVVPRGKWKLHALTAGWRKQDIAGAKVVRTYGDGELSATVTVGDKLTSLGIVKLVGVQGHESTWPISFEVDAEEGAAVSLEIRNELNTCGAIVDNVVLIPVNGNGAELIAGTDWDGWNTDAPGKAANTPLARVGAGFCEIGKSDPPYYKAMPVAPDGTVNGINAYINDCGGVYCEVEFPRAGRYRLEYHTACRFNADFLPDDVAWKYYYGAGIETSWTMDGEKHVIDVCQASTTNWLHHATEFTVRKAGSARLAFYGLNVPTKMQLGAGGMGDGGWDKRAFVFGPSLTRVGDILTDDAPEFESDVKISVAKNACLRLDYTGTNAVEEVRLGGIKRHGEISAKTFPEYIVGEGVLLAPPPSGGVLILR